MSMAANTISASDAAGMLYAMSVTKPNRVAKVGSGSRAAPELTIRLVQDAPRPQIVDAPRTADQIHAAFENARAALGSAVAVGVGMTPSSAAEQSGGGQPGGLAAYAQTGQAAGQTLDLTA